jgi:DNA repair protein RadD
MVHETSIQRLVAGGYWCPLRYDDGHQVVRRERLQLNGRGTDYTDGSVQMEFAEIGFVGKLCEVVAAKLAQGRKHIIVFTRFVDEARRVAAQFPGAAYVTGETPDHERDAIVAGFTNGTIPVVANVGVFSVGFDAPVIDCVVLGRPSVSLSTYYQQVGRAVRPHASKLYADIVDMVGLTRLFGRVEDLQLRTGGKHGREWTVCSGDRPLTDRYFSERDADPDAPLSPEEIKKKKRADFWRRRRGFRRKS